MTVATLRYGWVLPSGEFVECGIGQHTQTAARIFASATGQESPDACKAAMRAGWVKLSCFEKPFYDYDRDMTVSQHRVVVRWCMEAGIRPPPEIET